MPQTLPNGIATPINSDAYNLTADLATFGNSANVVIPVANQTVRDALTPYAGMCVSRLDLAGAPIQTYDGSAWNNAIVNSYTHTITATTNPTLGSGSQQLGQWQLINGKTMYVQFFIAWGTGGTVGSGIYNVSLPAGFTYAGVGSAIPLGNVKAHNAAADTSGYLTLFSAGASTLAGVWQVSTTTISSFQSGTMTWTSGGYFTGQAIVPLA